MRDPIMDFVLDGLTVNGKIDLDAYADAEVEHRVKPMSDYEQAVWDHMQEPPQARGGVMPWKGTHAQWQFRPGEVTVWTGKRGEGKSLVTGMVALDLMRQGNKCVIASMEMSVPETLERMTRQATGVENPTREYLSHFFQWGKEKLWLYDQIGTAPERSILGLCKFSITELGVSHVFLDSLMMIGFDVKSQWEKLEKQAEFVRSMVAVARDTRTHIHLVAHMRKGDGKSKQGSDDVKGGGDIVDLAGMCFLINANQNKRAEKAKPNPDEQKLTAPDFFLTCEKNRQGPVGDSVPLWLHEKSLQLVMSSKLRTLSFLSENSGIYSNQRSENL